MQNQNQLFEDFARMMSSIAGTMAGAGREAEAKMKDKFREAMGGMDFVSREEFEAVKQMAAETKAELEALKAQAGSAEAKTGSAPAAKAPRAKATKIDIN